MTVASNGPDGKAASYAVRWLVLLATLVQGFGGMSIAAAEPPPDVLWSWPADQIAGTPDQLALTGIKDGGAFKPTGLSLPEPPTAGRHSQPLPFDTDLLPLFDAVPFGAEERTTFTRDDKGFTLSCKAGLKPAGLLLRAEYFHYPNALRSSLVIEGQSSLPLSFAVVAVGKDAPPLHPIAADGKRLVSIPATAWQTGAATGPQQLVINCPEEAVAATLTAIRLVAEEDAFPGGAGTWLWGIRQWLGDPEGLVSALRREGIRDLFLQIRVEGGEIVEEPKLVALLAQLSQDGIAIHAVEGDADMVSVEGRAHALERARVLRDFKRRTGLIRSFQYDIEPYLRPAFAADPAIGWREWAISIRALAGTLGEKVSVVVPLWMLESQGGEQALQSVTDAMADITVMAYRTDGAEIERIAADWLDQGVENGLRISIAIENGPLSPEYIRTYARSEHGELVLDRSGERPQVKMLGSPVENSLTEATYSFTREMEVDPARISFLDDREALTVVRRKLEQNLAAWSSFDGLMIHGLIVPGGY